MESSWLPLTEYSAKYRISMSTLRRRIKSDDIKYKFEEGKYLIKDDHSSTQQRIHRPSPKKSEESLVGAQSLVKNSGEESVLASANKLVNEIKTAYAQILHEKEQQIIILKEEVSDLKTLVNALEAENSRIRCGL